jgi:hypothetical protein
MLHELDYDKDLDLTLGLVRKELRALVDGRTFVGEREMRGGQTGHYFLPNSFAVMAGPRHLGEDSSAQPLKTFTVIAKPVTVVVHGGSTEYELMFASFEDAQSGAISLGLEREVAYSDIVMHEELLDQRAAFPGIIDVVGSAKKASNRALMDMSLHPVGRQVSMGSKDPYFFGFMLGSTMGGDCRSLHISMAGEGEYDIKHSGEQHRYTPNAWVSASRLLENPNTFEKLCPWSAQFVEALRGNRENWTPEREQGLKTIR